MSSIYTYKPIQFFLLTILGTWIFWFMAAYLSHQRESEKLQPLFMILGLLMPFIVALVMIYTAKNPELISNFWDRLFFYRIGFSSFIMILIIIPAVFFLAMLISLLFGASKEQFALASEFNVMKGWSVFSLLITLLLAPTFEEIGWRGYGIDSLRSNFNLFYTSMLFAFLWALWHLPLFFIKGYYHYELRNLNILYVMNFFISLIPVAILMNWIYYKNFRSILIVIFAHVMLNALSVLFKMEQFTKCLVTLLLCLVSFIVIFKDKELFFK